MVKSVSHEIIITYDDIEVFSILKVGRGRSYDLKAFPSSDVTKIFIGGGAHDR